MFFSPSLPSFKCPFLIPWNLFIMLLKLPCTFFFFHPLWLLQLNRLFLLLYVKLFILIGCCLCAQVFNLNLDWSRLKFKLFAKNHPPHWITLLIINRCLNFKLVCHIICCARIDVCLCAQYECVQVQIRYESYSREKIFSAKRAALTFGFIYPFNRSTQGWKKKHICHFWLLWWVDSQTQGESVTVTVGEGHLSSVLL